MATLTTAGGAFSYTYDGNGNIASVTYGDKTTTYTYDTVNQLLREVNEKAGKTWVYTYDKAGNILTKEEYAHTMEWVGSMYAMLLRSIFRIPVAQPKKSHPVWGGIFSSLVQIVTPRSR